jgi:argininosuccinate lyase
MSKLWGGRFEKRTDRQVEEFTQSISVDSRLWEADIEASIAHARMLGAAGVLPLEDSHRIAEGLQAVGQEIAAELAQGRSPFDPLAEDVHSELEKKLAAKIGTIAGKLHTARSRNDQVATATRLYLRGQVDGLLGELHSLQSWLASSAPKHLHALLPGLTHMQHAQPVSLAHHLMAYFWMFERDRQRLIDARKRINQLPLGSAALAGTSFRLDRDQVSQSLGFDGVSPNSLDAVSDRDFVVEFLSAGALVMTHLSRLADELILWSTPEFGFVELDDSVTTGSSIMPQKKNPDVAELIRGRTGRLNGALMGMLTVLKALPLSYNRDLQEDKVHLFEGLDTVRSSLRLTQLMLESAEFRTERMEAALQSDFSNATDLADYLVRKGLPFRACHEIVGGIVRACLEKKRALEDLTLLELRDFSPLFESDIIAAIQPRAVMAARLSQGGTAPEAVKAQIERAIKTLETRA